MDISNIPMTHGMEVEQFGHIVPDEILNDRGNRFWGHWQHDPSGPREIALSPKKHVKRIMDGFNQTARQHSDYPWEWTSGHRGQGAGSHVHFNVDRLPDTESTVTAWTIAYNTLVDLLPAFAPFFCHNWETGFRNGGSYSGTRSIVERYASPNTTRFQTDTVRQWHTGISPGRDFESLTMNPSNGDKPLTMEIRMSDSHPVFALTGSFYLRKIAKRCLEREWSVKIDRRASDTSNVVQEMYDKSYNISSDENIVRRLQEPLKIVFERGIPMIDETEFDSAWDLLETILIHLNPQVKRADRRATDLVRYAGHLEQSRREDPFLVNLPPDIPNPARNPRSIWLTDQDNHQWEVGPEDAEA